MTNDELFARVADAGRPLFIPLARAARSSRLADAASGHGTGWECAHGTDQIGGRRCIRCCIAKDLSYVWRKPAGGSPGAFRWLCGPCEAVYATLGLLGAERMHVTNMANRARPAWVEARA